MHPRVENLPSPSPDHQRFLRAVGRGRPDRVPLIELAVHPEVALSLLDVRDARVAAQETDPRTLARQTVRLMHRLGYDVVKVSADIPFEIAWLRTTDCSALSDAPRAWQNEHDGPIRTPDDCSAFPWPRSDEIDLGPVETAAQALPDGMRLVGFCGGVLEYATYLLGLERFMLYIYDQPELIAEVCRRVGETIYEVFKVYCQMESICAIWLGDDLGGKNGLLVSPGVLSEHVFPWYSRYSNLAHESGRPFLLHTCGDTSKVMPNLIEDIGIDAKHSFEDAIQPVERFVDQWGSKVAALGGIDVNLLALGDKRAITSRTKQVLEHAAPSGSYACGSGNSIPNYVSPDNYLTMVEMVHRFNGRL